MNFYELNIMIHACPRHFLLEALILASISPKYDDRLLVDLLENYTFTSCYVDQIVLNVKTKAKNLMYTTCTECVFFLY